MIPMSEQTATNADTPADRTVREQDLRRDFEKVNQQVQKTMRETKTEPFSPLVEDSESDFVVEPVYAYRIHASS